MSLRNVTRNLTLGVAAGIALIATQSAWAADDRGSLQGVVNDASGKPVAGAMVKLKNAERRLTFMVPSQEQGRFEAKDLPVGQYTVQGVGGNFQSAVSAPVSVTTNASAKADVALDRRARPVAAAGLAAAHSGGACRQDLHGLQRSAGRREQDAGRPELHALP